jgi:hypothetical protein
MKTLYGKFLIIVSIGLIFSECQEQNDVNLNFTTGLNCKIYYGQGDCMPLIDFSKRKYNDYSGKVFIVNKGAYDNLININVNCNCILTNKIDSLKSKSISLNINDGKLIKELQPDSVIIMLDLDYTYYNDNVIYIKSDSIVTKDLYFFHCTSY